MTHDGGQSSTFSLCSWGQFLPPQAALVPTRRWVSPLFATGSAALRLSPVQHTVQVRTEAPRCAKWCEPPFLAPCVGLKLSELIWRNVQPPPPSPHFTSCLEGNEVTASYVKSRLVCLQTSALLTNIKTNRCPRLSVFVLIETMWPSQSGED